MDDVVCKCPGLSEGDLAHLRRIDNDAPIICDVSRADVFLYGLLAPNRAVALARYQPHSISAIPTESKAGTEYSYEQAALVFRTFRRSRPVQGLALTLSNAPIMMQAYPVIGATGRPIAVLTIETNLIEHERHRRRRRAFRQALNHLQLMFLRGDLSGAEGLTPFGEHDGILVADSSLRIRYISGVATNLYRRLGYQEHLVGRRLVTMATGDAELAQIALAEIRCLEVERREGYRHWARKALPIVPPPTVTGPFGIGLRRRSAGRPTEVMILVHDATAARRREQDMRVRSAMIQEVHHRVKNNLQSVASLLRLQARRSGNPDTQAALLESVNRVLSVAVVHEFLSEHTSRAINVREVAQRIVSQVVQTAVGTDRRIQVGVEGRSLFLSSQQATSCALVLNELLLNAVEHGFRGRDAGSIAVRLHDDGDHVTITVTDDGSGLPAEFGLTGDSNLGLTIVKTLVESDLKGRFELRSDQGTRATVTFPKGTLGGGDSWSEPE